MRALEGEERALWREAMRDVRPLRGSFQRARLTAEIKTRGPAADVAPISQPAPTGGGARVSHQAENQSGQNEAPAKAGLDRRTAQKLKRGRLAIAGRLDLHGMTQDEAHRALNRFIGASAAAGQRVVLVITGKSGVLRRMVPLWLGEGENRVRLLSIAPAQAPHGGAGAFYVLLRRQR